MPGIRELVQHSEERAIFQEQPKNEEEEEILISGMSNEEVVETIRDLVLKDAREQGLLGDALVQAAGMEIRKAINTRFPSIPTLVKEKIQRQVETDLLGYGPIQPLLEDPVVSEIMVVGPKNVYAERDGDLSLQPGIAFRDMQHLRNVIERIASTAGRSVNESTPIVDARLPDGSRVHAVLPPIALNGPFLTIRKFHHNLSINALIGLGAMDDRIVSFLQTAVAGRLTTIVSGGTGSGKTTMLNALSEWIPSDEAIITVEDTAELALQQPNVRGMEARQANAEGRGEITIRDLVKACLRMRPDRIVVGEVRSGEALDLIQAANTGHDGTLATIHANSAEDAIRRLETLSLMSGVELPHQAIREQIVSAIDIVVQTARLYDHSRKIIQVAEVIGMSEHGEVQLQDLFRFQQTATDARGKIVGKWVPCITADQFRHSEKLAMHGLKIDSRWFEP